MGRIYPAMAEIVRRVWEYGSRQLTALYSDGNPQFSYVGTSGGLNVWRNALTLSGQAGRIKSVRAMCVVAGALRVRITIDGKTARIASISNTASIYYYLNSSMEFSSAIIACDFRFKNSCIVDVEHNSSGNDLRCYGELEEI